MNKINPKVNFYFENAQKWPAEIEKLRTIVLDCNLTEELKWGVPCYTFQGGNVVLIHTFKEYCALLFFKGVLLKDPGNLLIRQTENVQARRQIRFTSVRQIVKLEPILKAYLAEAVKLEKAGLTIDLKKTADFHIPEEFQNTLSANPALKTAFEALTPGRQRAYLLYFSAPKQSVTRESRIARCLPQILIGKGLNG